MILGIRNYLQYICMYVCIMYMAHPRLDNYGYKEIKVTQLYMICMLKTKADRFR